MIPRIDLPVEDGRWLVLMGGGVDSAVALGWLARAGARVEAVHFDYGQKTLGRERESGQALCAHFDLAPLRTAEIPTLKALTGHAMLDPKQDLTTERPRLAYVPFRNTVFLALASACAEHEGFRHIVIGSHSDDRVCPDNSPPYIEAVQRVMDISRLAETPIALQAPFVHWRKHQIVTLGASVGVPFELTWSCYNRIPAACGRCGNCRDRLNAFAEAGIPDPLHHELPEDERCD
jgi:7-cyano-7-deazaguanine synthase